MSHISNGTSIKADQTHLCSLEGHVFKEVCGTIVAVCLVTAARIYPHPHSGSFREGGCLRCHSQAIWKRCHL